MENENSLIMYFIINDSLGMSPGKVAAQCTHACKMITIDYNNTKNSLPCFPKGGDKYKKVKDFESCNIHITLKASQSKFDKIKSEFDCFVVKDLGFTEVCPGSETVLVLRPMNKKSVPDIIKRLRLY